MSYLKKMETDKTQRSRPLLYYTGLTIRAGTIGIGAAVISGCGAYLLGASDKTADISATVGFSAGGLIALVTGILERIFERIPINSTEHNPPSEDRDCGDSRTTSSIYGQAGRM